MSQKLVKSLSYAWPYTLPILAGYVFFGFTYGILMKTGGFPVWYATLTSIVIYIGSLEFLMVPILQSAFNPASVFVTAILVGARHIFYGISMFSKYKNTGIKKFYLIYTCSDETFSVNYSIDVPEYIDKSYVYFWVSS